MLYTIRPQHAALISFTETSQRLISLRQCLHKILSNTNKGKLHPCGGRNWQWHPDLSFLICSLSLAALDGSSITEVDALTWTNLNCQDLTFFSMEYFFNFVSSLLIQEICSTEILYVISQYTHILDFWSLLGSKTLMTCHYCMLCKEGKGKTKSVCCHKILQKKKELGVLPLLLLHTMPLLPITHWTQRWSTKGQWSISYTTFSSSSLWISAIWWSLSRQRHSRGSKAVKKEKPQKHFYTNYFFFLTKELNQSDHEAITDDEEKLYHSARVVEVTTCDTSGEKQMSVSSYVQPSGQRQWVSQEDSTPRRCVKVLPTAFGLQCGEDVERFGKRFGGCCTNRVASFGGGWGMAWGGNSLPEMKIRLVITETSLSAGIEIKFCNQQQPHAPQSWTKACPPRWQCSPPQSGVHQRLPPKFGSGEDEMISLGVLVMTNTTTMADL